MAVSLDKQPLHGVTDPVVEHFRPSLEQSAMLTIADVQEVLERRGSVDDAPAA